MSESLVLNQYSKNILEKYEEFKNNWIGGLRSGEFIQTTTKMCNKEVRNSACCLFVMEMVCNNKCWEDGLNPENVEEGVYYLPSDMENCFHFDGTFGYDLPEHLSANIYSSDRRRLAPYSPSAWNDRLKLTFNQIADLLEYGEVELE